MKKQLIIILAILLAFIEMKAQSEEIVYSVFEPDTCRLYDEESSNPMYGLFLDIDQDSVQDISAIAICYNVVIPLELGLESVNPNWKVYPCFWYHSIPDTTLPGYITYVIDRYDDIRLDTVSNWRVYAGIGLILGDHSFSVYDTTFSNLLCGIRYETAGEDEEKQYYYGWIEFSNRYNGKISNPQWVKGWVCIQRMAFCTIPNYPLHVGQTSLDVVERPKSIAFAIVHPNPTNSMVTITGENLRHAELLNVFGQQVLSVQGKGNELHIDMTALPTGVYFVTVTDEEGRKCVRKVMKE